MYEIIYEQTVNRGMRDEHTTTIVLDTVETLAEVVAVTRRDASLSAREVVAA